MVHSRPIREGDAMMMRGFHSEWFLMFSVTYYFQYINTIYEGSWSVKQLECVYTNLVCSPVVSEFSSSA